MNDNEKSPKVDIIIAFESRNDNTLISTYCQGNALHKVESMFIILNILHVILHDLFQSTCIYKAYSKYMVSKWNISQRTLTFFIFRVRACEILNSSSLYIKTVL